MLLGDGAKAPAGDLIVHVVGQVLFVDVELSRMDANGDALRLASVDDLHSK